MIVLPEHGRVPCSVCFHPRQIEFDRTRLEGDGWRITANPLAWGNSRPEVVVLGFSKGPTQAGALARAPHEHIAYKGSRKNVGKILAHVGLLRPSDPDTLAGEVDRLIADQAGRFHFASFIRCTVERFDSKKNQWSGSGGGMLDRFLQTDFGARVAGNCSRQFLAQLPDSVKLVLMFGLGTKLNYVDAAYSQFRKVRGGAWRWLNQVAYTDDKIVVVHLEHFASQGPLIPNWLSELIHPRGELGIQARQAVSATLGR